MTFIHKTDLTSRDSWNADDEKTPMLYTLHTKHEYTDKHNILLMIILHFNHCKI